MSKQILQHFLLAILTISVISAPGFVLAASTQRDFKSVVGQIVGFLDAIVAVLVGIATLMFMYGAVEYIFQAGSEGDVEAGRNRMLNGIIGLFFIAVIWGLVQIVGSTFGLV